jgi:hypothetical protein
VALVGASEKPNASSGTVKAILVFEIRFTVVGSTATTPAVDANGVVPAAVIWAGTL